MRDASEVIAPCPFCGMDGKAKVYKSSDVEFYVACIGDFPRNGCSGAAFGATPDKAIAAWNKRATLPAAEPADAGRDAVAHRWVRNGEPQGPWVDGQPTARQFEAMNECKGLATWTVEYAYTRPPSEAAATKPRCAQCGYPLSSHSPLCNTTAALASQQAVKP